MRTYLARDVCSSAAPIEAPADPWAAAAWRGYPERLDEGAVRKRLRCVQSGTDVETRGEFCGDEEVCDAETEVSREMVIASSSCAELGGHGRLSQRTYLASGGNDLESFDDACDIVVRKSVEAASTTVLDRDDASREQDLEVLARGRRLHAGDAGQFSGRNLTVSEKR